MYNSPAGYLQDPLFSCLSIKDRIIYLENFMSGFLQSNLLWETELWSSEGQQPDKEYLRYTVVGKIFFPILHLFMFLLYMLLCNIWKSQEWLTSSEVASSKYNYLKRTKGKLSNTGQKLLLGGSWGKTSSYAVLLDMFYSVRHVVQLSR